MKHLVICDYGTFLGLDNHRLAVRHDKEVKHYPLNRLNTVSIAKLGVSFSSDLIKAFSSRGIKLFFLDFRGVAHSAILGESQHGVVAVRIAQMKFAESQERTIPLAKKIVGAKIKNQRAVLNYLHKYHKNNELASTSEQLSLNVAKVGKAKDIETILGFEGASASIYFQVLKQAKLFSASFEKREGRGSREINNSMLNLGYA